MKLLNTYIKGLGSKVQYGIIRPNFLQHGTTSGRYASRNPNFQNLPRDDERIKQCVTARPGKVFVSADQSQLEPRVFASYSQDKRLMDAFNGASDFYSVVGMEVYDKFD
jgi:DNA polymerase-1